MNLYESIKKNLNESEKLKESDYKIWSNHGQEEYYENMSREEMIKEIKASGWDEEEINGKPILSADDEDLREYLVPQDVDLDYEDYENSILPMIENQCYGDYLVLMGKAANWRGRGEASKAIKTSELKDYFFPNYDAIIQLYCDNQDNLYYTEANHDTPMGGTEMYLYSFKDETSYNNAEKLLQELYEDESWDMYYFCDWLGYEDAQKLIEHGFLTPVKRDPQYVGKVNESEKLKESEKDVKDQIRFICKVDNIPIDEEFINFVYNKHLDAFSGEIMKKLKKEYDKLKTKNEADESNEQKICSICGKAYTGYGNSAWPINSGYCCDTCNYSKVIPARLAQLRKSDESNNKNIKESTLINKNTEDFEDLVKRDFQNYIEDTYNIQNVQELADRLEHVTEEDINDYFTSLFYEIFDYNDMETANLAEEIIRKEYGLQDDMNESEEKNNVVKVFKDLPYQDFKAENTIGILNDETPFIVFDDNMVYIFDEQMTLDELKDKVYKSDDELNKYFEDHCKALDDNEKATHILVEIGRLNDDALNESEEKHFEEISSKSVRDSDGFTTDYTLYKDLDNNRYVCVFGDKEMYKPEDENFDFISDYEEEAKEWFNEYNGFDDDDDEYWEDHNDDPIECTIEYDEEGKPYFMYNNEREYIDEYMKDGAGGATKQLTAFSAIRIVPSDNGETVSVQYLHDSEEVKNSADDFETFQDKNAEKINKEYFKRYGKVDENKIDRKLWEEIADELYKKMNKNINESASIDINNLTKEQLWKLRQEIVLGSLYANDYNNSFGIDPSAVRNFFDSFIEDSQVDDYGKPNNRKTEEYDNADDLYNFYTSCENPFGEVEDINESEVFQDKYIFSNAQSEDKSDADSWADVYSREAPNLDFKVSKRGNMYFVDFIGSKEDIINYIKKLGWFNDDEIENYDLIKPLNEAEEETPKETKHKDAIQVYMNTRKNYDTHGADLDTYGIKDGWMNPDDALEFCEKYEKDGPFINDIDNNSDINIEISENDDVYSVLEGLAKLNDALYFGAGNAEKGDVPLVYEAWSDRESVSTPSLENIEEFIDFLENGEYYVHNDITSTYDIGKYYVDNVGFEGISNIENYIDTDKVKEDWQEEIDNDYLDDNGNPTEDWFEVDDSIVEDDIESAKQSNNTDFFDKYFDYESLGDEIYGDGYWYLTDNGSVELY